jgi:DNA-binding response OmpR family regulator
VELFAGWLEDDFDVRTATGGNEAMERFDEDVDVVLLDRRMPDLRGREVLSRIRVRDTSCQVALVTAVEPSTDAVDLGFDDYVVKPVDEAELAETVETLAVRSEYSERMREYFALVSKKAALSRARSADALTGDERYRHVEDRIGAVEGELDRLFRQLSGYEFFAALRTDSRAALKQATDS